MFDTILNMFLLVLLGLSLAAAGCQVDNDGGPFESSINCGSGPLFDRGPISITTFRLEEMGLAKSEVVSFAYDADERRVSARVERFDLDGTTALDSFEQIYTYDEAGRPVLAEWEDAEGSWQRKWIYDEQGRISNEVLERGADGQWIATVTDTFEYGPDGRPSRTVHQVHEGNAPSNGFAFEYDEQGRLEKEICLDPLNGWVPSSSYGIYEYDRHHRVTRRINYWVDDQAIAQEIDEMRFDYVANREWLAQSRHFTPVCVFFSAYQWQEDTLTITDSESCDGEEPVPYHKKVIVLSEEGSSAFYESTGATPVGNWMNWIYGNGVLNGCAGHGQ